MKRDFYFYLLAGVTVWDMTTTIFGVVEALGNGLLQILIAIALSIFLTFYFLLRAYIIIQNPSKEFDSILPKVLLGVTVSWDLFTAFIGNLRYVVMDNKGTEGIIVAIIITIVTCSAPILLSVKREKEKSE